MTLVITWTFSFEILAQSSKQRPLAALIGAVMLDLDDQRRTPSAVKHSYVDVSPAGRKPKGAL